MVHKKTLNSFEAYNANIQHMYNTGSTFAMPGTDLGNGAAMPPWMRPEAVPPKVKKKILRPGDKVAVVKSSSVNVSDRQRIMGKLLRTTT